MEGQTTSPENLPIFLRCMEVFVLDDVEPKEGTHFIYNHETQKADWFDLPLAIYATSDQAKTTGRDTKNSDGNHDWDVSDHTWIEDENPWIVPNTPPSPMGPF